MQAGRRRAQTLRVFHEGLVREERRRFQVAIHRREAAGQDGGREEPALHARDEGDLLLHRCHELPRLDVYASVSCFICSLLGEEPAAQTSDRALASLRAEGREEA